MPHAPIVLPSALRRRVEADADRLLQPEGAPPVAFDRPQGAPALAAPDSVSWRVFKNPVALFIGGVAAVILELGEPRVRAGVWDHTSFRTDPVRRLQRTGLAAMVTVYAPRETAEAMIAGVNRAHARIAGTAEDGRPYRADDPELLDWVQATASYGFLEAYHRFARPLALEERDRFYAEAAPAARLYGALDSPRSVAEWENRLSAALPGLGPSPVIAEFLEIMRRAPALPGLARPMLQPLLVRAALDLVPDQARARMALEGEPRLSPLQARLVRAAARAAERLPLRNGPAAQASRRMGLDEDWLYRSA